MKYRNSAEVIPAELLEEIQKYVQGEYIYIPVKEKSINRKKTEYAVEVCKRDEHIYTRHLEGMSNKELADLYALSESSIRRIIIKERNRNAYMDTIITEVLNNWNVQDKRIQQIHDTVWQIGDEYVLKKYDNKNTVEQNIRIITTLSSMGIPVEKIWETVSGHQYFEQDGYCYTLTGKLSGCNLVGTRDLEKVTYKVGEIIAKLHDAFKQCEEVAEFPQNSILDEMKGWIKDNFEADNWKSADKNEFMNTLEKLTSLYDSLPVQLIHRDVHFGNFLFDKGEFTGYIDFDLSQRNIRIFDLCYFTLSILSMENADEIKGNRWLDIVRDVFKGYNSLSKLTEEEKDAVPYVMMSVEYLFAAWFVSQNDVKCCENSLGIMRFVRDNIDKIRFALRGF